MNAVKLCEGRWSDISSWKFFLSDELPALECCTAASCVGLTESGDVVLSRTYRGWGCMGGHIEASETAVEAMRREALEEGGFRVERFRLMGFREVTNTQELISRQTGKPYPPFSYVPWFVAVSSLPLVPTAGDEGEVFESRIFSAQEACALQPEERPMIQAALKIFHQKDLTWQTS